MHLYKLLEILLKETNKLKNATVLVLRKKHNSVSSFCRDASKVILNNSLFNFGLVIKLFHSYQIECAFCEDIVRANFDYLSLNF